MLFDPSIILRDPPATNFSIVQINRTTNLGNRSALHSMKTHPPTVESLEPRIAPATLMNPHTVSYTDNDGDTVLVTTSKGAWSLATNFVFVPSGAAEQLQTINLKNATDFAGAKLQVKATGPGDGVARIGFIDATGVDLNSVTIDGDLGRLYAGDTIDSTPGLRTLRHVARQTRNHDPGRRRKPDRVRRRTPRKHEGD